MAEVLGRFQRSVVVCSALAAATVALGCDDATKMHSSSGPDASDAADLETEATFDAATILDAATTVHPGVTPAAEAAAMSCAWSVSAVAGGVESAGAIAVDRSGVPHMIVARDTRLHHFTPTDGTFSSEAVDYFRVTFPAASVVLDASDHLHVLFNAETGSVAHATNASGSWITELVDQTPAAIGTTHALAFDAGGALHAVYGKDVRHATLVDGTWSSEALPIPPNGFSDAALAIDREGAMHVASNAGPNMHSLLYATNGSGTWESFFIDFHVSPLKTPALLATTDGAVHMIFAQQTSQAGVRIVRVGEGATLKDQVAPLGTMTLCEVGAAEAPDGSIHAVYVDSDNPDYDPPRVAYATNRGGSWKECTIEMAGMVGVQAAAVAVDTQSRPHVLFTQGDDMGVLTAFYATIP